MRYLGSIASSWASFSLLSSNLWTSTSGGVVAGAVATAGAGSREDSDDVRDRLRLWGKVRDRRVNPHKTRVFSSSH